MREIKDGTKLIARWGNAFTYLTEGTTFLSQPEDYMQYAIMSLKYDEHVPRHIHKKRYREATTYPTHEFFVVLNGKVLATIYNDDKQELGTIVLTEGSFLCQHAGGHEFNAVRSETVMLEIKHGPFLGVEIDKEKF